MLVIEEEGKQTAPLTCNGLTVFVVRKDKALAYLEHITTGSYHVSSGHAAVWNHPT